jgi:hypothetical protein
VVAPINIAGAGYEGGIGALASTSFILHTWIKKSTCFAQMVSIGEKITSSGLA